MAMLIARFPYIMELIVDLAGAADAMRAAVAPSALTCLGMLYFILNPF
jgi:hypothetical protein